jgi:Rod binding domain-containing protein
MPTTIGSTTFPTGSATTSLMSKMPGFDANGLDATSHKPLGKALQVREKFQDFSAGTFYKEMLKSLRSGQKHSKYFYGGQAEEIFRGQMDQQIAEDLARQHGGAFSNPLFEAYSRQTGLAQSGSAQTSPAQSGSGPSPAVSPLSAQLSYGQFSPGQFSSGGGAHALDVIA